MHMALMTGEQHVESMRKLNLQRYMFGKKVEIYESRNHDEFKALKKLLKKNGIPYGTGWVQTEVACGCGAKINMRQVINPNYSPYVWSVYVRPENEEKARRIAEDLKTKSTGS